MKIVGVAACTAGIAHTYMAREKLIKGARARGHECRCETQGTIGTEYKLTEQEIVDLRADMKTSITWALDNCDLKKQFNNTCG